MVNSRVSAIKPRNGKKDGRRKIETSRKNNTQKQLHPACSVKKVVT
jgi:hypothetical protein